MGSNKKRKRLIYLAFVEPGPARIDRIIHFDELQSSFLSGNSLLWKRERCQGHSPLISTSSDQLKNVRTSTISPSTPTLTKVGSMATLWMMSAATSSSSPSTIDLPRYRRRPRKAAGPSRKRMSVTTYRPKARIEPITITATPATSKAVPISSIVCLVSIAYLQMYWILIFPCDRLSLCRQRFLNLCTHQFLVPTRDEYTQGQPLPKQRHQDHAVDDVCQQVALL